MKYEGRELKRVVFDKLEPGDVVMSEFHPGQIEHSVVIRVVPEGQEIPEFHITKPRTYNLVVIQSIGTIRFLEIAPYACRYYYLVSKAKPKDDFWWQDETQQGTLARALRETYKG